MILRNREKQKECSLRQRSIRFIIHLNLRRPNNKRQKTNWNLRLSRILISKGICNHRTQVACADLPNSNHLNFTN